MARKRNEVARVLIGPTVLPETKAALKRLTVDGTSAGEMIDRAVLMFERVGGDGKPMGLAFDAERVMEWMREGRRAPASQAFTAGAERQVAYCFEEVVGQGVVLGESGGRPIEASPYALSRIGRIASEFGATPGAALDMVVDLWDSANGASAGSGQDGEPVTIPAVPPVGLQSGPVHGEVVCQCAHCPRGFRAARFGNLCPGCFEGGHSGDPRECAECNTAVAL